ncbi:MAG: protease SohB [Pseudomonadales bacterium]|nr:protease SohB [Pseudomonadales bacterium]MCP5331576.1 protease SohB [Pseudomonadales bacterium]MCP5343459.1 protease SohB [Pseudomonadales bacterium]
MEYFIDYVLFLAKVATLVVAFMFILGALISAGSRGKKGGSGKGSLQIVHLNEELDDIRDAIRKSVLDKEEYKQVQKLEKKRLKQEARERKQALATAAADENEDSIKKRVYVLDFDGDIEASQLECLREEITAVLSLATSRDEVILRLESPGGMVHAYGLASSQLQRIRDKDISLTICVDKVAASGGYMMACLANRLVAAPFAILGSIGVLVQLPNFHRLLRKHEVDYETISAGEFKTTLTTFGEITQKGRDKVKEDVEEMHTLFKAWVKEHRPVVEIDNIATGETWVGLQALERKMVDALMTSDECIVNACEDADVYSVHYEIRQSIGDRLGAAIHSTLDRTLLAWWKRARESSFYS